MEEEAEAYTQSLEAGDKAKVRPSLILGDRQCVHESDMERQALSIDRQPGRIRKASTTLPPPQLSVKVNSCYVPSFSPPAFPLSSSSPSHPSSASASSFAASSAPSSSLSFYQAWRRGQTLKNNDVSSRGLRLFGFGKGSVATTSSLSTLSSLSAKSAYQPLSTPPEHCARDELITPLRGRLAIAGLCSPPSSPSARSACGATSPSEGLSTATWSLNSSFAEGGSSVRRSSLLGVVLNGVRENAGAVGRLSIAEGTETSTSDRRSSTIRRHRRDSSGRGEYYQKSDHSAAVRGNYSEVVSAVDDKLERAHNKQSYADVERPCAAEYTGNDNFTSASPNGLFSIPSASGVPSWRSLARCNYVVEEGEDEDEGQHIDKYESGHAEISRHTLSRCGPQSPPRLSTAQLFSLREVLLEQECPNRGSFSEEVLREALRRSLPADHAWLSNSELVKDLLSAPTSECALEATLSKGPLELALWRGKVSHSQIKSDLGDIAEEDSHGVAVEDATDSTRDPNKFFRHELEAELDPQSSFTSKPRVSFVTVPSVYKQSHEDQEISFVTTHQGSFTAEESGVVKFGESTAATLRGNLSSTARNGGEQAQEQSTERHKEGDNNPIDPTSFLMRACQTAEASDDTKLEFMFRLFDKKGTGLISRSEIKEILRLAFNSSSIQLVGTDYEALTDILFSRGGVVGQEMNLQQFKDALDGVEADILQPTIGGAARRVSQERPQGREPHRKKKDLHSAGSMEATMSQSAGRARAPGHGDSAKLISKTTTEKRNRIRSMHKYVKNQWLQIVWCGLYVLLCLLAFIFKFTEYTREKATTEMVGIALALARGSAQVILISSGLLYLSVCRDLLSELRTVNALWNIVPFDSNIDFHKVLGSVIAFFSMVHCVAHAFDLAAISEAQEDIYMASLFRSRPFSSYPPPTSEVLGALPVWTGLLMTLCLVLAIPWTIPRIRKHNFNYFWFSHMLLLPFTILLFFHGSWSWVGPWRSWAYLSLPFLCYIVERRHRYARKMFSSPLRILKASVNKETTILYIERPQNFTIRFRPGMYVYLNIPRLSRFEYHPFTVSSAPQDPFISLHIRRNGDWTNALHEEIGKILREGAHEQDESLENGIHRQKETSVGDSVMVTGENKNVIQDQLDKHRAIRDEPAASEPGGEITSEDGADLSSPYIKSPLAATVTLPHCYIEGPVGAPSQDYHRYPVAVLIGAGIGVTPFASILKDIFYLWEEHRCARCRHLNYPRSFQLKQLYFYWTSPYQENFSWFADTVNQLSAADVEGRVQFHHYLTRVKNTGGEEAAVAVKLAQSVMHKATGQDVVSGLRTKTLTHFGRPDWASIFEQISAQHAGREVGVFYCGPRNLKRVLDKCCQKINRERKKTARLRFHAENF